ncbi:hypothetical protein [Massilia genomosp. 1]|uniref:hypothetical protein n=1 Tax=Massilia genomosp. 1 TaxID=2609280 RepID=UPI0016527789|nr:hypothetical protein [Massilia genomosp. 1]
MRRLKVLTWHTHGSYLYYLSQAPHDFYVLSRPGRPPGYGGRTCNMPRCDKVHDMPVPEARHHQFDCIVFQDHAQDEKDQYEFLSASQRALAGESGFIDTNLGTLVGHMHELGRKPALARALGAQGRKRMGSRTDVFP